MNQIQYSQNDELGIRKSSHEGPSRWAVAFAALATAGAVAAGISVALDDGSSTEAPLAVAEVAPSIVVDHPALAAVERPGHISFDLMTRKDAQHNPVPAAAEAEVERPGHVHPEFLTRKDAQHDTAGS